MSFNYKNVKNFIFLIVGLLLVIASIIPTGSWSYFNDKEIAPKKTIAAGTCSFEVDDISNLPKMIPGVPQSKVLNISSTGSLPINDLYLYTDIGEESTIDPSIFNVEISSETSKVIEKLTVAELIEEPINISDLLPKNEDGTIKGIGNEQELDITLTFSLPESETEKIANVSELEEKNLKVSFELQGKCS